MLVRLILLLNLLGLSVGPDYREDEERLGGQAFGGVIIAFVAIGLIVLIGLVVLAIMALNGRFDLPAFDPLT